tara:strand:- start:124 stop:891 length:768 start_codon:yes stop_codon:yes gene_type:complete
LIFAVRADSNHDMAKNTPPPTDILNDHALFLDFDGTLAPLQDDPHTVAMPDASFNALPGLFQALNGALAIVSGRDVRDLSSRVPQTVWRAGGHGVDICSPGEVAPPSTQSAPEALTLGFDAVAEQFDGVWCEAKGPIIAVHYRQAPGTAEALGSQLSSVLKTVDGYKLQAGKMVYEAKPLTANKGRAIEHLMRQAAFAGRIPVMFGDDVTDEDGFAVVIEMGGFAVKIGEGDSLAQYRLETPNDVAEWLNKVNSQ